MHRLRISSQIADSWRRPYRNLLRRTAKSVIQGHPRSRPFAEASAVATRRCRRNCGGVYSNEGAEVLSYAARKHAAANSYTESAPAPAASRGQAGSRGHKTPVFLVTQDESLWPQIGPSLDRDWALKQVDTIDELLRVTRAGQPGIIVWDAREPADREGDLSRVQLHCSRFAVVVLDADTGTERWKDGHSAAADRRAGGHTIRCRATDRGLFERTRGMPHARHRARRVRPGRACRICAAARQRPATALVQAGTGRRRVPGRRGRLSPASAHRAARPDRARRLACRHRTRAAGRCARGRRRTGRRAPRQGSSGHARSALRRAGRRQRPGVCTATC